MSRIVKIFACFLLFNSSAEVLAQKAETPIRIFGYFQNQFKQEGNPVPNRGDTNSFLLQQLNLFFQKNLSKNWSAFVNFEVLNTFSSSRNTGAFNLEEAWVKYRLNRNFNVRLGLQIPTFNYLNRIKNRTPLLPYIVRPLIYETSLSEIIPVEEFAPARSFLEVYGVLPLQGVKFDYAVSLGNGPNIRTTGQEGQSGVDTTATFLIGGRLGIRWQELRVGISATYDKANRFQRLAAQIPQVKELLREIPRVRLGLDFAYRLGPVSVDAELIRLDYERRIPVANLDKEFIYATLGWRAVEELVIYGGFWRTSSYLNRRTGEGTTPGNQNFKDIVNGPNFGAAYNLNDRVVLKGQMIHFYRSTDRQEAPPGPGFNIVTFAVSVMF